MLRNRFSAPSWSALTILFVASPVRAQALIPLQGDASAVISSIHQPVGTLAFYLGPELETLNRTTPELFAGGGPELTLSNGPLEPLTTWGLQLRAGVTWGLERVGPYAVHSGRAYVRVTPFLGMETNPKGSSRSAVGVRVAVGATAIAWTRVLLNLGSETFPDPDVVEQTLRVFTTLLLLPLSFLNHAELSYELPSGFSTEQGHFALRVGAGF